MSWNLSLQLNNLYAAVRALQASAISNPVAAPLRINAVSATTQYGIIDCGSISANRTSGQLILTNYAGTPTLTLNADNTSLFAGLATFTNGLMTNDATTGVSTSLITDYFGSGLTIAPTNDTLFNIYNILNPFGQPVSFTFKTGIPLVNRLKISSAGLDVNGAVIATGAVSGSAYTITTSTSGGNLLLANNAGVPGNWAVSTDSSQHLRFSGGATNILTIGGATNGAISIPASLGTITMGTTGSIICNNYVCNGNNNLSLTSFSAGGSPALLFNANSYNNINLPGRYGNLSAQGWSFEDGNSAGPTQLCGINNVGFYVPNAGYFITGQRYNFLFGGSFANGDQVLYNNGGGTVAITTLGTNTVYSNGGRLSNTGPSDRTLKENINPLNPQLENVLKLKPVSFNWIDKAMSGDKLCNGFIAQEVQEINDISNLVSTFKDNHDKDKLGLDIVGLIPFIVKAVQEQNELVVNQQTEITDLKAQLASLKATMDALIAQKELLVV